MSRFPRPQGAIESYEELKIGDELWYVCGVWRPFMSSHPEKVTSLSNPFHSHPQYSEIHEAAKDKIVFETISLDPLFSHLKPHMSFASDKNLQPSHSHNDNYVFRTKEEAQNAVAYLTAQYKANPEYIEAEKERMRFDDYDEVDDYLDIQEP